MGRVVTQDELILLVGEKKRNGQRIVFTHGCFDLLHPGHIRLLEQARGLGDALIVAIDGDASVSGNKGAGRPLIPQDERAEILAALEAVEYVVILDDAAPQRLIARVLPDVLVKGSDEGPNEVVGREDVEASGGRMDSIALEPGYSTAKVIERIRNSAS